ncbi:MAG TPA: hypothetical protein VIE65_21455 [Methylobacter sp.]|jgi:hypothetical protein
MKTTKITPLTAQQCAEIYSDIYGEIDRAVYTNTLAAKRLKHPEYGDIVLVSSNNGGCLMIHVDPSLGTPHE